MKKNSSNLAPRLQSLDTLRGCDMFFIMGGGAFFASICAFFPDSSVASAIANQFKHVPWNGFAFEDMIFPLFLFIAGISFPYSLDNSKRKNLSSTKIHLNVIRRGIVLILLGIVYNGFFHLDFENMRCASVLGRIGLAWMFSALIFLHTNTKQRGFVAALILIGYWLLITFVPAPDGDGNPFSKEGSLVGYIDRLFMPGVLLYRGVHDPEGLLSAVPAIATAMFGMLTGEFVKSKKFNISESKKVLYLIVCGVALIIIGKLWNIVFPINKNLWSSSFVCFVGGISLIAFSVFYYLIDVKGLKGWTLAFRVIGMNSITIYLAQSMINFRYTANYFFGGFIALFENETMQNLLNSSIYIITCWLFLYFLYKKNIFLKV
ncbi:MAG: DUF5009 domain-containing protein [Bacteroidales bacterium]|nr:DUF5009 domain-containing protein [Bacteroidales bacterium]